MSKWIPTLSFALPSALVLLTTRMLFHSDLQGFRESLTTAERNQEIGIAA